jgi:DNA-binding beta-propeller fold protein YncE
MRPRLASLLVPILLAWQSISVAADSRLYFTDPGQSDQVSRLNLDGSNLDVVTAFPSIVDPRALAIDGLNGKAYFSSGSTLQRVNFDGSGLESLGPSGGSVPTDIALDVKGNAMYWSVENAGIKRATLAGTGTVTLVSQSLLNSLVGVDPLVRADDVSGIAVDLEGGRIYWANDKHLNSMPLSGVIAGPDAVHQFELSGAGDINKIKLDLENDVVYWTNNGGSLVQRAGLTGAGQTTLVARGFGRPAGLAVDFVGEKLYFGDTLGTAGRGEILSANLDGSDPLVIYPSGSSLFTPLDLELGPEVAGPFLEADFEEDHDVDVADLEFWKTNFGLTETATHTQGDANADLDVDGGDFLVWQVQLGAESPAVSNVPEPTTAVLLILGYAVANMFSRCGLSRRAAFVAQ